MWMRRGGSGDTAGAHGEGIGTWLVDPEVVGRAWRGLGTLGEGTRGRHLCPFHQGVSLELRPGEVLAVVAPPGAGKSTLVSLVLCLRPPGSGRVLLDGHPLPACQHPYQRCQVPPPPCDTMSPAGRHCHPLCPQLSPMGPAQPRPRPSSCPQ